MMLELARLRTFPYAAAAGLAARWMEKQTRAAACSLVGGCQKTALEYEIGFFRVLSAVAIAATPYRFLFPWMVGALWLGAGVGFLAGVF